VDFTLTSDQRLIRDSARALLEKECPTSLVRAHIGDPAAADRLWKHLREWSGLGLGPWVDLCLFLEESGARLLPGPFFATTALFIPILRALDHPLCERAAAGEITGTVGIAGRSGDWIVNDDRVKAFIPEAERVDWVALVVPGPAVVLRERPKARYVETVDTSRRLGEVEVGESSSGSPISEDALGNVLERATIALSAEMLGTARWLFETTLAYAKVRVQFGKPIGSFQAVQHKLANMRLALERGWSAVYYAAMTIDAEDPDRHRAAHVAKAAAGDAAKLCAKDGIQIHGGIGYTWEHDLHLYIRRAYASEFLLGPSDWHRDRLAELIL
jgi:alkylation response protein AidB-like acyl-CoA dehydrogenase